MKGDEHDPKALIREAYNIDGISAGECRTIFLDWALSLPDEQDQAVSLALLLARHGQEGHPMTDVLRAAQSAPAKPKRRGGWRSRER